ncbi:hypothetical protein LCGC14_0855010 [marine sediment metagenome]|uniref:Uncharacterized protein n=1 Tax=marine sediment metagenome TaxID=412755 RepID=A0A0F9P980_9ZZZZ
MSSEIVSIDMECERFGCKRSGKTYSDRIQLVLCQEDFEEFSEWLDSNESLREELTDLALQGTLSFGEKVKQGYLEKILAKLIGKTVADLVQSAVEAGYTGYQKGEEETNPPEFRHLKEKCQNCGLENTIKISSNALFWKCANCKVRNYLSRL